MKTTLCIPPPHTLVFDELEVGTYFVFASDTSESAPLIYRKVDNLRALCINPESISYFSEVKHPQTQVRRVCALQATLEP